MAFNAYDHDAPPPLAIKILVAGGFGAGKTTMVTSVSEISPLRTEEVLTTESTGVDDLAGVETKHATTVALDFGRITFDEGYVLFLFGTPGQRRFRFVWDELANGALGAVVLADVRRLADCFDIVDHFEARGLPFIIAVNRFEAAGAYTPEEIRVACGLPETTPVIPCDARDPDSAKTVLITLIRHLLAAVPARTP